MCTGLKGEIRRVGLGRAGGEAAGEGPGKEMRWQWGETSRNREGRNQTREYAACKARTPKALQV